MAAHRPSRQVLGSPRAIELPTLDLTALPRPTISEPRPVGRHSTDGPAVVGMSWLSFANRESAAPLQFLILLVAGWIDRRQGEVLEYSSDGCSPGKESSAPGGTMLCERFR